MSFTYKTAEKICFFLNRNANGLVKKQMHRSFLYPKEVKDLPRYICRKFAVSKVDYKGFHVFVIRNRNIQMRRQKAVLFLAGGGGLMGPMGIHFDTAARLVQRSGATMYFAFYPLAPEYNVWDALEWLEGVYRAMRNRFHEKDICFMGDSAGANLALSLAYRLKRKQGKVIAISPAPGLEYGKSRDVRKEMEPKDPILSVTMNDLVAELWAKNVPLDSPDVNPAYIDYYNFPEVLLLYGTHEVFYPHVKSMIAKMKVQGTNVVCIEKEMCHDWALCSFFPEGREALEQMAEFIEGM